MPGEFKGLRESSGLFGREESARRRPDLYQPQEECGKEDQHNGQSAHEQTECERSDELPYPVVRRNMGKMTVLSKSTVARPEKNSWQARLAIPVEKW